MYCINKKNILCAIAITSICLLCAAGLFGYFSAQWYISTYGNVGFDAVLYSWFASFDSVESGLIFSYIKGAAIPALTCTAAACTALLVKPQKRIILHLRKYRYTIFPFSKPMAIFLSALICCVLLHNAANTMGIFSYVETTVTETTFLQDNYVDPNKVKITFPKQKQNLIYIYLESMETTFLSTDLGGGNSVNTIPELYKLASENINFSQNDGVGGFSSLYGCNWTIGAMVSSTSGVPLKIPLKLTENYYTKSTFLPGLTTLSDILHSNGYYQALMVGSNASYANRRQYYQQHGTDIVYDLYTAREDNIVPEDYFVWWGMEDEKLYDYAKQELTKMAEKQQPFAFTMLTADTHSIGGYVCQQCCNDYSEQYENVLACSSRQVYEFVLWIQQQDFYKNTTIIISGDHPTMDAEFINRNIAEGYTRKVYNCFINTIATAQNTKNREFCSLDMFPTTLAAIGCTIEGDRLGLGTNLFSSTPTLCEEIGIENLDQELSNDSEYYTRVFLQLS